MPWKESKVRGRKAEAPAGLQTTADSIKYIFNIDIQQRKQCDPTKAERKGIIMLEYLLFDLDGTLTDSSEGITKSVQYGLESIGIQVEDLKELLCFIGPPLEYSFREFYHLDEERMKTAVTKYRERYNQVGKFENALYPGMAALLKDMKKRGKHLALATSKPEYFARQILRHFNVEQYFDVVVGSGLDGSLGTKEEVVEEALRQLFAEDETKQASAKRKKAELTEEQREKTAMIGDRRFDVEGGKRYGLVTIGVEYGFADEGELKEAKADYIVRTVEELHELLKRGSEDADHMRMKDYNKLQKKKGLREEARKKQLEREAKGKEFGSFRKAVDILLPLLLYFLVYDAAGFLISILAGVIGERIGGSFYETMLTNTENVRGVLTILTLLVTTGAMYPLAKWEFFFRYEPMPVRRLSPEAKTDSRRMCAAKRFGNGVVFVIAAVSASLGMNLLFTLCHITELSENYGAAAESRNAMALGVGIILYGFVSPLAEEMLFRGLVYNRMKQYFTQTLAIVLSALFFGLYHGNLVQGPFGLILGIAMAGLYEQYGKWYVPAVFHGIVNLTSYLLFAHMPEKSGAIGWISCVIFMTIWISSMIFLGKRKKK